LAEAEVLGGQVQLRARITLAAVAAGLVVVMAARVTTRTSAMLREVLVEELAR
jgi:hypothetical protein